MFSDQELVSKAAGLREEQDKWNDLFATKLIELLDKIENLQASVKAEMTSAADQRLSAEELDRSRELLPLLEERLAASASLELAKQALAAHPDVDVVIPHDVLEHFQNHTDVMGHLIDGHQNLDHLDHAMGIGVQHAEAAAIHFHVPYISVAFIVWTTFQRYRTGEISPMEALRKMTERITSSFLAVGAAYLAQAICHKSIAGIPVGIWVRYKTGKFFKRNELRRVIDQRIIFVRDATSSLGTELRRRKLVLALGD